MQFQSTITMIKLPERYISMDHMQDIKQMLCEAVIRSALQFAMKYYPNEQMVDEEIAQGGVAAQIFEIEIEHMSGKEIQER